MSSVIGVVGLVAAIVFLIVAAYKGLGPLPLSLCASMIIILTNGMDIWESLSGLYMQGYAGAFSSYFLILAFSALYAKVMDTTKCTKTIGMKMIDWFGKKSVVLISILIGAIMTYGGISAFVVVFAAGPILLMLCKEANLPRQLCMGLIYCGASSFTLGAMPGTPQLANIIPTGFLGTSLTAAPVLGILISIAMFAMGFVYMSFRAKQELALGHGFVAPPHMGENAFTPVPADERPAALNAFLPPIFLIVFLVVGGKFIDNSTLLTCLAMLLGTLLCIVLNFKFLKGVDLKKMFNDGLVDGISGCAPLAAIVGFGTLVSNSPAFTSIVQAVLNLQMSPYFKGIFSTAVIAGVTGSSSAGIRIMFQNMTDYFVASGCNLNILHRLCATAATSLDTLPHVSAIFLVFSFFGTNHREAYKDVFVVSVIVPGICAIVGAAIVTVLGM